MSFRVAGNAFRDLIMFAALRRRCFSSRTWEPVFLVDVVDLFFFLLAQSKDQAITDHCSCMVELVRVFGLQKYIVYYIMSSYVHTLVFLKQ